MRKITALLFLALLGLAPQGYPPAAQIREAFLKQLDRPRVAADRNVVETKSDGGFVTECFTIATEKKASGQIERMPVLLVKPEKPEGRLAAVVVLHGTGGNKEGQRGWCQNLAKQGIIGIAIDARYHGDRAEGKKGAARYNEAMQRAKTLAPEPAK